MARPALWSMLLLVSATFGSADAEPADPQLLAAFRAAHAAFKADAGAECVALSMMHREVFAMMERLARDNMTVPDDERKNTTARQMESSDAVAAPPAAATAADEEVTRGNATAERRLTLGECLDTDNGAFDYFGETCADYAAESAAGWSSGWGNWCGNYDAIDFTSSEMCCACGGGGVPTASPTLGPSATPSPTPGPSATPSPTRALPTSSPTVAPPTPSPTAGPVVIEAQGLPALRGAIAQAAASGYKLVVVVVANMITLQSPLVIEGDVTIASRGGAVLSGGGSNRLFEVSATGALRGENITFQDGISNDRGGAIFNSGGKMELKNCKLTGNTAEYGGALYSDAGQVELNNCKLTANYAYEGGALYADGSSSSVKLNNCDLTGNSASAFGGAIRSWLGYVELDNCDLTKNDALKGGAIYHWGSLKLKNCNLQRNNAGSKAGAIYNDGSVVELKDCNITQNVAVVSSCF